MKEIQLRMNSAIVFKDLQEEFTLSELQKHVEGFSEVKYDKRNFRKSVKGFDFIESTGKKQTNTAHRAAEIFKLKK